MEEWVCVKVLKNIYLFVINQPLEKVESNNFNIKLLTHNSLYFN